MSSLVNKVKDAIPGTHSNKASAPEGSHGTHNSRVANAADPRIDSDRDNRAAAPIGTTHDNMTYSTNDNYTYGSANQTDGPHKSNIANKLDPRVDSDRDNSRNMGMNPQGTATTNTHGTAHTGTVHTGTTHTGTAATRGNLPEGTVGPHSSRMANAADPRVDSDLDSGRNRMGTATTGTHGTAHAGTMGTAPIGTHGTAHAGTTGTTTTRSNLPEGTVGPHSSRLANAADPRVDSDLDSGRNMGASTMGTTTTHGTHPTHGTHGTVHNGTTGTTTTRGNVPEGTFGPHSSRMANAADPRVDSDLDSGRTRGTTGTSGLTGSTAQTTHGTHATHGTTGNNIPEGTFGSHNSRLANAADPRIDSDLDSGRNRHAGTTTTTHTTHPTGVTGTHTTGPATETAGPHKSNLLNKADPRVDSDLDGSKTVGGNKTFSQSGQVTHKDPTDAAQVPPSVLQRHVGGPVPQEEQHTRHVV